MIKSLRKIHNKKFYNNDRAEGLPVESKEFEGIARYIIFEGSMAITTKNNGVLTGNMGQLEKLFKEALNVIEIYKEGQNLTLQQKLNKYIEKYCLSGAEVARRIGTHPSQVSQIRLRNVYTPALAEKIYKVFGDEFREYFEYEICPYCGIEYVPRDGRQKTCLSDDCVKKHRVDVTREYERKVNSGEHIMRTFSERRPAKKKYRVNPDHKPGEPLKDYNERAREEFGSYGQRAAAERLAQSTTMSESMGCGYANISSERPVQPRKNKLDDVVWVRR